MSAPILSNLGERLRDRTAPLAADDQDYGHAHAHLCEALMVMFEQVAAIFDPDDPVPPGAPLLAPGVCPPFALSWLGQIVGVPVPVGAASDQARALISSLGRYATGTPAALRAAAGFYLTGTKTVYFRERNADPYRLQVVTLISETPDAAKVLAALIAQKPGGIVLDYHTVTGWDYTQLTTAGGTYTALRTQFTSYDNLRDNTPG